MIESDLFKSSRILVVDDQMANLKVLTGLLKNICGAIQIATDGESALRLVERGRPDLILLDVMMPGMNGFEVCRRLKSISNLPQIPVIFMTALNNVSDKVKGFEAGGVDYIIKPFEHEEVLARVKTHLTLQALQNELTFKNTLLQNQALHLAELVKAKTLELAQLNDAFIVALEKANYFNDTDTGSHIKRVSLYSRVLAEGLQVPADICLQINQFASIHDIGKVCTPSHILKKIGRLTDAEMTVMREHCYTGYKMIDHPVIPDIAKNIVYAHHEKWDGSGYPRGLRSVDIPLEARIVALADVYDALRNARSYKPAFSQEKTHELILADTGMHFDPDIVRVYLANEDAFNKIHCEYGDLNQYLDMTIVN